MTQKLISFFPKNSDSSHESVGPPRVAYLSPYPKLFESIKSKKSASHHLKHIRFKSLSGSLENLVKFCQKFVFVQHFDGILRQIALNIHYVQATSKKTN